MAEFQPKPTVLIFSTAYLPMVGGAELAIKEITDRLGQDFNFVLFTARLKRSLSKHECLGAVDVFRFGFGAIPFLDKLFSPFLAAYFARKFIKKNKTVLFWSMMATYTSGAPFILKVLGLNKGVPILLTLQEGDSESHLKFSNLGLTGFSWMMAVRLADKIQVISRFLRDFSMRIGAPAEKIVIVPNGADLNIFNKDVAPEELRELKIKHGINDKQKVVITASRLVHKNAVDVLIKAIAEIPDAHLFIAGAGPEEKTLKELASLLRLEKRIHFMGNMSHGALSKYYNIAHVFARPSRSEGLGSAFLEAMGAGLPIIGTNIGGIPDFLKHNETGLFCEVDDPRDLAIKIKRFLHDPDFRKKIGQNAKKLVYENYSWDKIAVTMGGIFYRFTRAQ